MFVSGILKTYTFYKPTQGQLRHQLTALKKLTQARGLYLVIKWAVFLKHLTV